jgi:putative selenium metabolism hydrolase
MDEQKSALVSFCQDIIRIPSQPCKENQVAKRILSEMEELDFDSVDIDEYGSVVGVISRGEGPTIVVDAHMDTVGVEPIKDWDYDPYGAWLEEGKIYGRGAIDMKGPLAAVVHGISKLATEQFNGKVVASLSTMEEKCEGVALANVLDKHRADFLIIAEPTNLNLARAQKGRAELSVSTHGLTAHSSTPEYGIDAVEKMMKLIAAMNEMPLPDHPFLGNGILALTDIISDPYPAISMVPFKCTATFDRRMVSGETEASVLKETRALIESLARNDKDFKAEVDIARDNFKAYTGQEFEFKKFLKPWEMAENHPTVEAAARALSQVQNRDVEITSYNFCTNGSLPSRHQDIPTLGFGPGQEELAHRKNEYIIVEDLEMGAKCYPELIKALLEL